MAGKPRWEREGDEWRRLVFTHARSLGEGGVVGGVVAVVVVGGGGVVFLPLALALCVCVCVCISHSGGLLNHSRSLARSRSS